MKRIIIDYPDGAALVEQPEGVRVRIGRGEHLELDATDKQWSDLKSQLETGKLDFAKVKKTHALTGDQTH